MKKLLLQEWHEQNGGKMGEFAGYSMPLYYSKPLDEHHMVRQQAGVFDISHMGQFTLNGERAEAYLDHLLTNDVTSMHDGQALYTPMCQEDGGVLDDLIIYRYSPQQYRIIVNAGTKDKDWNWMKQHTNAFGVDLQDISDDWCLFAVQGPQAFAKLAPHLGTAPDSLGYYHFAETEAFGAPVFLARTGYTGEPGCEMAVPKAHAQALWLELIQNLGIAPIGLAARDSLRLEAAMALYTHELKEEWNPLECGVGFAVKLETPADFIGKQALVAAKAAGLPYRLVGIEMEERGIPRTDYPVLASTEAGAEPIGVVTSGVMSPTTGKSIALARVKASHAKQGSTLAVEIRGKAVAAKVVARPFYQNPAVRA